MTDDDEGDALSRAGAGVCGAVWLTGGASMFGLRGVGALTDWQIAALLLGFALLCVALAFSGALWLFGKQRFADWISRHIA